MSMVTRKPKQYLSSKNMANKNNKSVDTTIVKVRLNDKAIVALDNEAKKRGLTRASVAKEKVCQNISSKGEQSIASATIRAHQEFKHLSKALEKYGDKANLNAIIKDAISAQMYVLDRYDAFFGKPSLEKYILRNPEKPRKKITATLKDDAEKKTNDLGQRYTELKIVTEKGDLIVYSLSTTPIEFLKKGTKVCLVGYYMEESEFYADSILIFEDSINK